MDQDELDDKIIAVMARAPTSWWTAWGVFKCIPGSNPIVVGNRLDAFAKVGVKVTKINSSVGLMYQLMGPVVICKEEDQ